MHGSTEIELAEHALFHRNEACDTGTTPLLRSMRCDHYSTTMEHATRAISTSSLELHFTDFFEEKRPYL